VTANFHDLTAHHEVVGVNKSPPSVALFALSDPLSLNFLMPMGWLRYPRE
jgi:hypothetical protein